jgi:predicted kinase
MDSKEPTLYIFSGLHGTGKSTLAKKLATALRAVYIIIDTANKTIEECIKELLKKIHKTHND